MEVRAYCNLLLIYLMIAQLPIRKASEKMHVQRKKVHWFRKNVVVFKCVIKVSSRTLSGVDVSVDKIYF